MISSVVMSFDRPLQLHCLLESLEKNAPDFLQETYAVCKSSNEEFKQGYGILQERFPDVHYVEETDFKKDIMDSVEKCPDHMIFFTDDDIIYRPLPGSNEEMVDLVSQPNVACLSFRLGQNSVVQDQHRGQMCILPQNANLINDQYLVWNRTEIPPFNNYNYPLSVDGHLFEKQFVLDTLGPLDWDYPNGLEGAWQSKLDVTPQLMLAFKESVLINSPTNRVQDRCLNKAGEIYGISQEDLNKMYLEGLVVDLEATDFSDIRGAHQELEFVFKNYS